MGCIADRVSRRDRPCVHYGDERLRTVFQNLPIYGHRAHSLVHFRGGTHKPHWKDLLESYAAVCLEGAIIVLGCIIFSVFTANPPAVDTSASATTMVWSYLGELIFNLLVLTGTIKMADRVVREMFGL